MARRHLTVMMLVLAGVALSARIGAQPPWGTSISNPYGLGDDIPGATSPGGMARSDVNYPYRYARFGSAVAESGVVTTEIDPVPFLYLPYSPDFDHNWAADTFLMAVPNGPSGEPHRCFNGEGDYVPWGDVTVALEAPPSGSPWLRVTSGPGHTLDSGARYWLFRRLRINPDSDGMAAFQMDGASLDSTTRGVIVMIHGWRSGPTAWDQMNANILGQLTPGRDDCWRVVRYDWAANAATGDLFGTKQQSAESAATKEFITATRNASEAAEAAHMHGLYLADRLREAAPGLQHVHLIAHSAGSHAARAAAAQLLEHTTAAVQVTLLDPFLPYECGAESALGVATISALNNGARPPRQLENYFVRDDRTDLFGLANCTSGFFDWGIGAAQHRLDVDGRNDYYDGHDGPIYFYADTVSGHVNTDPPLLFEWPDFGWTLSAFEQAPSLCGTVEPTPTVSPVPTTVAPTVTPTPTPMVPIAGAEWFMGPWTHSLAEIDPGPGQATPVSGTFGATTAEFSLPPISTQSLAPGVYSIGVRVRDEQGRWGYAVRQDIVIQAPSQVAELRANFGPEPQPEGGMPVPFVDRNPGASVVDVAAALTLPGTLQPGRHTLWLTALDDHGRWGISRRTTVEVVPAISVVHAEAILEPSEFQGAPIIIPASLIAEGEWRANLDTSDVLPGDYRVVMRVQDSWERWSDRPGGSPPATTLTVAPLGPAEWRVY